MCCSSVARRRRWHPTPVLLPGKSHERRSLVGYRPWGREESDTTERLHFHFSPSCPGEGNGTPLQCSCLENPRDGGAWWAAAYGVAQSWTRLQRLCSSSSSVSKSASFFKLTTAQDLEAVRNTDFSFSSLNSYCPHESLFLEIPFDIMVVCSSPNHTC